MFRTEEYLKTVRLVNKKQLQAMGGNPKNNLNITSRHVKDARLHHQHVGQDAQEESSNQQLTLNSNLEDFKRHSIEAEGHKKRSKNNKIIQIDEEAITDADIEAYHLE